MTGHIESEKILIKDVFSRKWYRVADYQRPYVRGSDQVNELLDDLRQAEQSGRETEYFLGSLVLQSVQGATLGYGPVALPLNQDPNTADLIGTLPNDFGKVQVQNGFVQYFPGLQTQRAPLPNFGGDANLAGRFSNQVVVDRNSNIVLQNPQPGTTGNSSYRWFNGPGHMRFDAALSKRIQIAESKAFTIRADAINLLNRPIWGDPNTDINSASFGRITGYARGYFPRTITIGTRFDF